MKDKQQTLKEAFSPEARVKPEGQEKRVDSCITKLSHQKLMFNNELMEEVCQRDNLKLAYKRVMRNKGAPGIDGMNVIELGNFLRTHWLEIKEQLLNGTYQPKPVKCVMIPKPNNNEKRQLGIPCVLDRFIQQALLQVLQGKWDPKFSESSFGFRPGRSAHQAIARAQELLKQGYEYVVDIDLENFFDRVNHDRLMSKLQGKIEDKRALKLIRSFLNAGIMEGGLVKPLTGGVPQGGPLSPFLSNIVLDEFDRELEARGHKHVRYGDDCNIYVKSKRAGERAKESIQEFIEKRLKLKVNGKKSAVDVPNKRKFLGFSFTGGIKPKRRKIAPESISRFKAKVKEITRRNRGLEMKEFIRQLTQYFRGWLAYFSYTEARSVLKELDGWVRRRLRCIHWKQWKTFRRRKCELIKRGIEEGLAARTAMSPKGPWKLSQVPEVRIALSIRYFDELGLLRLAGK